MNDQDKKIKWQRYLKFFFLLFNFNILKTSHPWKFISEFFKTGQPRKFMSVKVFETHHQQNRENFCPRKLLHLKYVNSSKHYTPGEEPSSSTLTWRIVIGKLSTVKLTPIKLSNVYFPWVNLFILRYLLTNRTVFENMGKIEWFSSWLHIGKQALIWFSGTLQRVKLVAVSGLRKWCLWKRYILCISQRNFRSLKLTSACGYMKGFQEAIHLQGYFWRRGKGRLFNWGLSSQRDFTSYPS